MLNSKIVLVVLLSALVCCQAEWPEEQWSAQSPNRIFFARGVELMDQFKVINDRLEKNTVSEEPYPNFAFLDKPLENKKKSRFSLSRTNSSLDPKMDNALALFKSLRQINETNQCNLNSYNILLQNYNAANGLPQWGFEKIFAGRRVNKLVRKIAEGHAKTCQSLYYGRYKEEISKVDQDQKIFAETLVKNMIHRRHGQEEGAEILRNAESLFKFALDNAMTHKVTNDPGYSLNELRRLAKDDPNSKYVEPQPTEYLGKQILEINKSELQKLYSEYIHKPCEEYIMKLETVFKPAEFDTKFVKTPAKDAELDYYLDWAAFSLCDTMVLYEKTVPSNIAEYADRMTKAGKPF